MFGERHFATRERLVGVIQGIADLAADSHATRGLAKTLTDLVEAERPPFSLMVCGEINAGKSTFINGLLGTNLCPASKLPETNRLLHYQYGAAAESVEISSHHQIELRPYESLRDVQFIDTPGTNSGDRKNLELITQHLPSADLIFFVFPVTNPWSAPTWNLIARVPPAHLDRVVLIVQQSDQKEAIDLSVIRGHMADLSTKRIGHIPPLFTVSGKLACEAKLNPSNARRLFANSGYALLESFIAQRIDASKTHQQLLENWLQTSSAVLREVDQHLESRVDVLAGQGRFLDTIEREIADIRESFVTRLPDHLATVAEIFESEAVWVTKRLRRKLSVLPSFCRVFMGDRTGSSMEGIFVQRLQSAVEAVAAKDGLSVTEICLQHWKDLCERVQAATGLDIGSSSPPDQILADAKARFVQRLGTAARHGIGNLKVRNQLDKDLRRRNVALKSFILMTLIFTTAGGICGGLAIPWLPAIFCGLAALFLTGGILTAIATKKPITLDFRQRLLATCGDFANTLRADYEEALRLVFYDYATCLQEIRTYLAREKLATEPNLKRWQELFLTLKAIEQEHF